MQQRPSGIFTNKLSPFHTSQVVNNVTREALVHVPASIAAAASRGGEFPLVMNWHGMMEQPTEQQGTNIHRHRRTLLFYICVDVNVSNDRIDKKTMYWPMGCVAGFRVFFDYFMYICTQVIK